MKRHVQGIASNPFERVAALSAVLAVAGLLASGSSSVLASQVICGASITTDTKLTRDVENCPNNGIVIAADNITLDLNGHQVGGDGEPVASCPESQSCDVGVDNSAGHSRVTIRGGTVHGFDAGVLVVGA